MSSVFYLALSMADSVFMCHTCLVIHSKYSNNKYTNYTSHNYASLFFSFAVSGEGQGLDYLLAGYFKCTWV